VANYNIDIVAQIKGNEKLTKFNERLKGTAFEVRQLNKFLKEFQQGGNGLVRSFNSLNQVLSNAKANFNAVASGTKLQEKAARQLIVAEKELNKELKQREALLQRLSVAPLPLPGSGVGSDPVAKSIARRRRKLSRGANQYSGPIGPGEAVSANLRSPLPPSESIFRGQSVNIEKRIEQTLQNRKKSEREIIDLRNRASKKMEANEKKLIILRKKALKQEFAERRRLLRQNQFANVNPGMGGFRAFSQKADQITAGSGGGRTGGNIPTLGGLASGFNLKSQFAEGGAFAATKGQRVRGALSSGLIGGGFPLLFGQGGLGAAGGGIGGVAGGALGGGFGFGLSIVGTAIAQQIQQTLDFRKSIRELNKEMEQMGISSNISGSQVRQLGKSLGITKEEAVKALQEFKRFGNDAVLIAKKFGGDSAKFDALTQANTVQSALSAIRKINKDLTLDDELRFINSVRRKGVEATINEMLDEMLEKQEKLDTKGFGQGVGGRKRPAVLKREREQLKEINSENGELIEKLTTIRDKYGEIAIANELSSYSIVKGLEDVNREIRKLNDAQFQIVELSKALGSAFSESFKGIIKGTMSVQDAFRNMFSRIADHFLDMAAQMMAAQLQKGFLGMFGSLFNPFGAVMGGAGYFDPVTGLGTAGPNFGLADGGTAKAGSTYMVGERGPELFSPGVTGTVTPNHALGGSTNIVVNVDASGSNVEGDEDQGRELGRLISVAVQSELIQQQRPGGLLA